MCYKMHCKSLEIMCYAFLSSPHPKFESLVKLDENEA